MDVNVKAKTGFVHGKFSLRKGEVAAIPEAVAKELQKAGLVEPVSAATAAQAAAAAKPTAAPRGRAGAAKATAKKMTDDSGAFPAGDGTIGDRAPAGGDNNPADPPGLGGVPGSGDGDDGSVGGDSSTGTGAGEESK